MPASPIEDALHVALLAFAPPGRLIWDHTDGPYRYRTNTDDITSGDMYQDSKPFLDGSAVDDDVLDSIDVNASVSMYRSVCISTYRADILMVADRWRRIVVECDGHDFHDRTKQQAAYDRARDRELLTMGFITIRFTGSEIHHSPERCAREAWRCLLSLHDVDTYAELNWRTWCEFGETHASSAATEISPEEHW